MMMQRILKTPKALRSLVTGFLVAGLISYFVFHGISGRYGLWAFLALKERTETLREQHRDATRRNAQLARDIALLRSDRLDPDLLGELARKNLHLLHPNDIILLPAPNNAAN